MHVYIVFAHPSHQSFSYAVLQAFTRGLSEAGHTFDIADLYAMNFVGDMDTAQYQREVGLVPTAPVPPDVKREHESIDKADALVFIYPLWWSDCPAKLKGWFDRVWTFGYAYVYDDDGAHTSTISLDKALVICSAGHTAEHLEEIGIAESMRNIMLHDRLLGVGAKQANMEILGGMMPHDNTYRQTNLERAYLLGEEF
jgi:NAD(P)H dehydrogenase (quinone)